MYELRSISSSDIEKLDGFKLRPEDIEELVVATPFSEPTSALLYTIAHDENTSVAYDHISGEVFMYYGCASVGNIGMPWMVATPLLDKYIYSMVKEGKKIVSEMLAKHPILLNYVDARNTTHIQWLKWMGFSFEEKFNQKIEGYKFLYFYKRRED